MGIACRLGLVLLLVACQGTDGSSAPAGHHDAGDVPADSGSAGEGSGDGDGDGDGDGAAAVEPDASIPMQPLPVPEPRLDQRGGPGLGNLGYDEDELWQPVARIDHRNGVPSDSPGKPYGLNAALLHDGYLMTVFAPDSGGGPGGMLFYDVHDPRSITLAQRIYEPSGRTAQFREAHAIGLSYFGGGEYAALHTGRGIEIWEVSDIHAPEQVGKLELSGVNFGDYDNVAWQLFWQGRYLYVAGAEQGIFIVDTSDPAAPVLVDRGPGRANPVPPSELGGFRIGPLFAVGNLLVVTSMEAQYGYSVLGLGDPKNPQLYATRREGLRFFYATTFNGNRIVSAVRGTGARMAVHDITDPRRIELVDDSLVIDDQLYAATQDRYVFEGCQEEVVKIDVSIPGDYDIVGRGTLAVDHSDHGQVTPFGNLVFVGNDHGSGSGLIVHDRDPDTSPPRVNMVQPADGARAQPLTTRVGVTFTDNVEPYSINETTFVVRKVGEAEPIPGRFAVQQAIVNFWPDEELEPDTTYEVFVQANGVADWAENLATETFHSTFSTVPDIEEPPLDAALVAWWPLDAQGESTVLDSSPTGATGVLLGDAHVGDEGLVLDGAGDAVQVTHPALDFDGDLTLALWARTSTTSTAGADTADQWWYGQWLVDKDVGGNDLGWALTNHHGKAKFHVNQDAETLVSTTRIDDGAWHHIVGTHVRSTGTRALYVDGVLEAFGGSGAVSTLSNDADLYLGSEKGNGRFFAGELRDVRVYARELASDEVAALMQGGGRLKVALAPLPAVVTGSSVTIAAQATGSGSIEYSFDFGDGSLPTPFGTSSSVMRSYAAPGHYPVTVTATNGIEVASSSHLLTVYRPTVARGTRSRSIAHDGGSGLVCAVNPDHDTTTCFDALTLAQRFEAAVGAHPSSLAFGPNGTLYVANEGSDSVSVLRLSDGAPVRTIAMPRGSHPYGVTTDPVRGRVFVTLEATGELVQLRPSDGMVLSTRAVGTGPRGIAISHDGAKAYVSRFVSPDAGGELRVVDLSTSAAPVLVTLAPDTTTVDAENRARGLPNYLGAPSLSPDASMLVVPAKKDNIFRGLARDGRKLTFETTVRALALRVDLASNTERVAERIDFNDREGPRDAEFTPMGDYMFVALSGSDMVSVRDAYSGALVTDLQDTGSAPIGVALNSDGSRLFVHNFLSRDVAVYDTRQLVASSEFAPALIGRVATTATEPLAADVLRGKQLFYLAKDPRLDRDGYLACASCHFESGHDGRTWDFSDRGEGLRNTITLVGRAGTSQGRVHWSANFDEIQDFENDIRGPFGGRGLLTDADWEEGTRRQPLGDPKAGRSSDLDALAAFVSSLGSYPRSPFRAADGTASADGEAGKALFGSLGCASCHAGASFTDSPSGVLHDVGTIRDSSGQRLGGPLIGIDTPTLRGVWQTAPYLHDGAAATLLDVLVGQNPDDLHGDVSSLSADQRNQLVRYLRELE